MPAEQLVLLPTPAKTPRTYWECRGPKDWRPVTVVTWFGDSRGAPQPVFPLIVSRALAPRNVRLVREDDSECVRPLRSLRRVKPGGAS